MTNPTRRTFGVTGLAGVAYCVRAHAQERARRSLSLSLKSRSAEGEPRISSVALDARKIAIVGVDIWTSHSCSGFNQYSTPLLSRINHVFDACRKLAIPVIFAPSGDDLKRLEGKAQRVNIGKLPVHPMPASNEFLKDHGTNGPFGTPCMCKITALKPGTSDPVFQCNRVEHNYNQHPAIKVEDGDFFIAAGQYRPGVKSAIRSWGEPAQQELWNFIQERGITHLLYVGFATNMCIINREFAMLQMRRLGIETLLVRDATLSITYNGYNPMTRVLDPSFSPDDGTRYAIEYIEQRIAARGATPEI